MDKSLKESILGTSSVQYKSGPSTSLVHQHQTPGHGKKTKQLLTKITHPNSIAQATLLSKTNDGTIGFTYKKLVVPSSMRSAYWKYFGFPATDDGLILSKLKIICILCKTQISYNRNTSNLRMHLQNKHKDELVQLEIECPPKVLKPKSMLQVPQKKNKSSEHYIYAADVDNPMGNDIQFLANGVNVSNEFEHFDEGHDELIRLNSTNISDAIADFVIMDLQQPDVVEGKGFQRLIATLQSPCEIPSKAKIVQDIIPKMFDTYKQNVITSIENCPGHFGLSLEQWHSLNGETFVTFAIHFLTSDEDAYALKTLTSIPSPPHADSTFWTNTLNAICKEWKIPIERIIACISAVKIGPLLVAIQQKNIIIIPCLVATLQDICTSCCFLSPEVYPTISKCRKLISTIYKNPSCVVTLKIEEQLSHVEDTSCSADYPPVWISTYAFLEGCLARKYVLPVALEASDLSPPEKECLTLNEAEWAMIEDIINVLDPFKITMMTLSEEKTPLISLIRPLLWQLVSSHLKVKDTDSNFARRLKVTLSESLERSYDEETVRSLLLVATALDPRFKLLPCCTDDGYFTVLEERVKGLLINLIRQEGVVNPGKGEPNQPSDGSQPSKKSRLSGMEFLLGGAHTLKSDIGIEERANHEVFQFQSESTAPLDDCPLQWWKKQGSRCPNLAKLVRKYNCLPASATPSCRIPTDTQVSFQIKRMSLSPDIVDKLLFLNSNHTIKDGGD
ncbi:E3 SUMO-protein ligase ZBED1 isoform X2 [Bemisia tabaci]|uniref:E3 SUMO-protein ligase ZBED1 isoform X2 n=1 Tax=Bemisia tabaci TaxID=7038 RepID=UPI0008F9D224|nr:PREDICTED: zinc finger BED domain-containing protein 1 isoform X2 [Bemisia tabaci]